MYADVTNNYPRDAQHSSDRLKQLLSIRSATGVKVLFSVGGWANSQYFSTVANDPLLVDTFVSSIKSMIDAYSFDGVDIGI